LLYPLSYRGDVLEFYRIAAGVAESQHEPASIMEVPVASSR